MTLFKTANQLYKHAAEGGIKRQELDIVINWPEESLSILFGVTKDNRIVQACSSAKNNQSVRRTRMLPWATAGPAVLCRNKRIYYGGLSYFRRR
jgi:hypothetical protein